MSVENDPRSELGEDIYWNADKKQGLTVMKYAKEQGFVEKRVNSVPAGDKKITRLVDDLGNEIIFYPFGGSPTGFIITSSIPSIPVVLDAEVYLDPIAQYNKAYVKGLEKRDLPQVKEKEGKYRSWLITRDVMNGMLTKIAEKFPDFEQLEGNPEENDPAILYSNGEDEVVFVWREKHGKYSVSVTKGAFEIVYGFPMTMFKLDPPSPPSPAEDKDDEKKEQ